MNQRSEDKDHICDSPPFRVHHFLYLRYVLLHLRLLDLCALLRKMADREKKYPSLYPSIA